jgi:hypothetical protein
MENIKYLLRFLFKLAVIAFFAALVWWGVVTFNPGFRLYSLVSITTATSTGNNGWLPSPRAFRGLLNKPKTPNPNENEGVIYGKVFNGYGNQSGEQFDYVTYKEAGVQMAQGKGVPTSNASGQGGSTSTSTQSQNGYAQKSSFIRNLSIYEGGYVYTGLSFVGEARNTMFINGKFPIIVADRATGRALSISYGEATTDWAVPGWVRFQVKINGAFPNNVPCTMVFEQAQYSGSQVSPTRVAIPVVCN